MWRIMIYGILMWAVTIYAIRRGGGTEKLAAVGIVGNSYLTPLLLNPTGTEFQQVEVSVVFVDCALLVLLLLIALQSRKFWPLWLTAIQGVTILGHFAPLVHLSPWMYQRAVASWSWPMLILLGYAVRQHSLERVRRGIKV